LAIHIPNPYPIASCHGLGSLPSFPLLPLVRLCLAPTSQASGACFLCPLLLIPLDAAPAWQRSIFFNFYSLILFINSIDANLPSSLSPRTSKSTLFGSSGQNDRVALDAEASFFSPLSNGATLFRNLLVDLPSGFFKNRQPKVLISLALFFSVKCHDGSHCIFCFSQRHLVSCPKQRPHPLFPRPAQAPLPFSGPFLFTL